MNAGDLLPQTWWKAEGLIGTKRNLVCVQTRRIEAKQGELLDRGGGDDALQHNPDGEE